MVVCMAVNIYGGKPMVFLMHLTQYFLGLQQNTHNILGVSSTEIVCLFWGMIEQSNQKWKTQESILVFKRTMISDVHVHKHQHITNRPHGADILYEHHSSFFFKLFSASQEAEAKFETAHPVTFLKKCIIICL